MTSCLGRPSPLPSTASSTPCATGTRAPRLLVVGPILCPIHEATPGPGAPDFDGGEVRFRAAGDPSGVNTGPTGKLSLQVVRDELAGVIAQRADDVNLHLLDGLALDGESDSVALPLPDRLHPDRATHRLITERFAAYAFAPGGPFLAAAGP